MLEYIEKGTRSQKSNILIDTKIEQELIAADKKVRCSFDRTFQVAIVCGIVLNDGQGEGTDVTEFPKGSLLHR